MSQSGWIDKLKNRWHVKSTMQVIIILVVFACTGFTVMFIKPVIMDILFKEGKNTIFSILYWVLILPIYNLFLLLYGFIFGQFHFFWEFEKRFFGRIIKKRKISSKAQKEHENVRT